MITFCISGHGFGHASRDIEVINRIGGCRPDAAVAIRTPARRWLFDLTLRHQASIEHVETDTGIVQIDSLRLDAAASIRRAAEFYRNLDGRAAQEAAVLRACAARLVVGDIPPLAFRAAALAGIPAIALGNFTWDWIYAGYDEWLKEAPGLVETIGRAYETAMFAIRLPMYGGFATIRKVRDVPFVARRSQRRPEDTRTALGLDARRPVALLSFGGHGLAGLNLAAIDATPKWTIVTTGQVTAAHDKDRTTAVPRSGAHVHAYRPKSDVQSPMSKDADLGPRILDEQHLYARGIRYEDLVAAADVVVTKPGYGIISECLANNTAILYTSRGHFVEYDVLVEAMPHFLRSRFIAPEDLYAGRWLSHLDALVAQPAPEEQPPANGADVAAKLILEAYDG